MRIATHRRARAQARKHTHAQLVTTGLASGDRWSNRAMPGPPIVRIEPLPALFGRNRVAAVGPLLSVTDSRFLFNGDWFGWTVVGSRLQQVRPPPIHPSRPLPMVLGRDCRVEPGPAQRDQA